MEDILPLVQALAAAYIIAVGIVLTMWTFGKCLQYLTIWKAAKEEANKILKRKR